MALPSLVKTWNFDPNVILPSLGSTAADNQRLLLTIKNKLLVWSGGKWIVKGSSNGSAAAMDGVDRWNTNSNLRWNWPQTGPRSWIVLKRSDAPLEILIDLCWNYSWSSWCFMRPVMSSAGFTGGTTTLRPTATDEEVMFWGNYFEYGGQWHNAVDTAFNCVLHSFYSSDGNVVRFVIMRSGAVMGYISFEAIQNPVTNLNPTHLICFSRGDSSYGTLNDTPAYYGHQSGHNWLYRCYLATEGYMNAMVGEKLTVAPNELSMEWPMVPTSFLSDTHGCRGRHGIPYDLYYATTVQNNGDAYPAGGAATWMVFGDLILPWYGGPVVLS